MASRYRPLDAGGFEVERDDGTIIPMPSLTEEQLQGFGVEPDPGFQARLDAAPDERTAGGRSMMGALGGGGVADRTGMPATGGGGMSGASDLPEGPTAAAAASPAAAPARPARVNPLEGQRATQSEAGRTPMAGFGSGGGAGAPDGFAQQNAGAGIGILRRGIMRAGGSRAATPERDRQLGHTEQRGPQVSQDAIDRVDEAYDDSRVQLENAAAEEQEALRLRLQHEDQLQGQIEMRRVKLEERQAEEEQIRATQRIRMDQALGDVERATEESQRVAAGRDGKPVDYRIWGDRNTAGRVMSAIVVGLGELSRGIQGGSQNMAAKVMADARAEALQFHKEKAAKAERAQLGREKSAALGVQSAKDQLAGQESLYERMRREHLSPEAAEAATQAALVQAQRSQLRQVAMRTKSSDTMQRYQTLDGALGVEQQKYLADMERANGAAVSTRFQHEDAVAAASWGPSAEPFEKTLARAKRMYKDPEKALQMAMAARGDISAGSVIERAGRTQLDEVPFAERKDARERQVRLPDGSYAFAKSASDAKESEEKMFAIRGLKDLNDRMRKVMTKGSALSVSDHRALESLEKQRTIAYNKAAKLGALDGGTIEILEPVMKGGMVTDGGTDRLDQLDRTLDDDARRGAERLYKDHKATQAYQGAQKSSAELEKDSGIRKKKAP